MDKKILTKKVRIIIALGILITSIIGIYYTWTKPVYENINEYNFCYSLLNEEEYTKCYLKDKNDVYSIQDNEKETKIIYDSSTKEKYFLKDDIIQKKEKSNTLNTFEIDKNVSNIIKSTGISEYTLILAEKNKVIDKENFTENENLILKNYFSNINKKTLKNMQYSYNDKKIKIKTLDKNGLTNYVNFEILINDDVKEIEVPKK